MELKYSVFECHRAKQLQTSRQLIEDLIQRNITTNDSNWTTSSPTTFFPNSNLEGLAINYLDSKLNE